MSKILNIFCEGRLDQIILEGFARKLMKKYLQVQNVNITVANGKENLVRLASDRSQNQEQKIVIMDMDDDEDEIDEVIKQLESAKVIAPNPTLANEWLEINDRELKFLSSEHEQWKKVNNLLSEINIESLKNRSASFKNFDGLFQLQ